MDAERPKGGITGSLSVGRAAVVLILFVAAVAILVAVGTRPSVSGVPSSAQTTVPTSTTTTAPGGSTTTVAAAASTTTTAAGHHRRGTPATTTTTIAPASVSVVVANATQTSGLAAHYTTVIGGSGYMMKTPIDASTSETTSAVYYAPGFAQPAAAIATAIGVKPTQVLPITTAAPVTGVTGIDVVVVIGSDLATTTATT